MTHFFSVPPFYTSYVKQPNTENPPSLFFRNNSKLWPWFQHALGAIDGSHIHAHPRGANRHLYRNRKGFFSQNCLFCCNWNLLFTYGLTGWEGSASDAKLYTSAIDKYGLRISNGWYYLADAGFAHCMELLVPFCGTRYHLAEWGRYNARYSLLLDATLIFGLINNGRPQTPQELFNLRHAQARNAIERIFGAFKKRFRILHLGSEFPMHIQAQLPAALAAIHNFIRLHDLEDGDLDGSFEDFNESYEDRIHAFAADG